MRPYLVFEISWVVKTKSDLIESFKELQLIVRTEVIKILMIFYEDLNQSFKEPSVIFGDEALNLGQPQLLDKDGKF